LNHETLVDVSDLGKNVIFLKKRHWVSDVFAGMCLKGVSRHGTMVESWGRSRLRLKVAPKHMGDIVVQVRWHLGREGRISKVVMIL